MNIQMELLVQTVRQTECSLSTCQIILDFSKTAGDHDVIVLTYCLSRLCYGTKFELHTSTTFLSHEFCGNFFLASMVPYN